MVGFALGNSGKNVNEEWHRFREVAISTTYTLDEWGDIDITKYDLDEKEFTGKDVDRNYRFDHVVSDDEVSVTGFDVRDLPTHD
jgi:hypothetical protein